MICGLDGRDRSRDIGWERGGSRSRDASRSRCNIYGRM